jgi:hypothetical protein
MSLLASRSGTIVDLDEAACALLGRDRRTVLGVDFCDLLSPPYRELCASMHTRDFILPAAVELQVKEEKTGNPPVRILTWAAKGGDGSSCLVEVTGTAISRRGAEYVVMSLRLFVPLSASVVLGSAGHMVSSRDLDLIGFGRGELADKRGGPLFPLSVVSLPEGVAVEYVVSAKRAEPVLTRLCVRRGAEETVTLLFERVDCTTCVAVLLLDAQGMVRDCGAFCTPRVTGYTREQLLNRSINVVVPLLFPVAPAGVTFSCEGIHKDGHALYLATTLTRTASGMLCCQLSRQSVSHGLEASRAAYEGPELHEVCMGALLGWGAFSVVRLGRHGDRLSAIKFIPQKNASAALKEAEILRALDHPAIAKLHFVRHTECRFAIAMEFCPGTELGCYVKSRGGALCEGESKLYFRQLCSAVCYIHGMRIAHCDLKTENVMVLLGDVDWRRNQVKLIDFGVSVRVEPGVMQTVCCGTPAYAAPEVLALKPHSGPETDVWSLGIVLYVMLQGKFPFPNRRAIQETPFPDALVTNRCCANLLSSMLQKDPRGRFTMAQVAAHAWLNEDLNALGA